MADLEMVHDMTNRIGIVGIKEKIATPHKIRQKGGDISYKTV